jgi:hypothetical protein
MAVIGVGMYAGEFPCSLPCVFPLSAPLTLRTALVFRASARLSAMFRDKAFCKMYGMIMMVYAFVIGLTAILTGLETPLYVEALQHVEDPRCRAMAQMMVDTNKSHAILYGINCVLDCAGAIFAIQSHQVFEYEDIESRHRSAEQDNMGL